MTTFPPPVVARYADVADFASHGASATTARDAWVQVGALRSQVSPERRFLCAFVAPLSLRKACGPAP